MLQVERARALLFAPDRLEPSVKLRYVGGIDGRRDGRRLGVIDRGLGDLESLWQYRAGEVGVFHAPTPA